MSRPSSNRSQWERGKERTKGKTSILEHPILSNFKLRQARNLYPFTACVIASAAKACPELAEGQSPSLQTGDCFGAKNAPRNDNLNSYHYQSFGTKNAKVQ